MKEKIFMFGCWNKNLCLDRQPYNGRKQVFELLKKESNDYDFGILLGDNIYPHKNRQTKKRSKRKTFTKKFLTSNVYKYQEIIKIAQSISNKKSKISLHVILGNHDVEKKCVLTNQIKEFSSPTSKIYPKNSIFETENAVFLFLNTNNIGKLIEFINEFDISMLDNRWLILCGHDPLFSYKPKIKKKKGKTKKKTFQKINELPHIFSSISKLDYPKMIYVCADTHNYQFNEIEYISEFDDIRIPVIVVGTGGAKPDSLKSIEKHETHFNDDSQLYVHSLDYNEPFGFLQMEIDENIISLNYKKCGEENYTEIFFNNKSKELNYRFDRIEEECKLPKSSCEFDSPEKHFFEIC